MIRFIVLDITKKPMVDTFTSFQLLRFVYQECSVTENQILEECLVNDFELQEEQRLLKEAKQFLPKAMFNAHPSSLQNILEYSRF